MGAIWGSPLRSRVQASRDYVAGVASRRHHFLWVSLLGMVATVIGSGTAALVEGHRSPGTEALPGVPRPVVGRRHPRAAVTGGGETAVAGPLSRPSARRRSLPSSAPLLGERRPRPGWRTLLAFAGHLADVAGSARGDGERTGRRPSDGDDRPERVFDLLVVGAWGRPSDGSGLWPVLAEGDRRLHAARSRDRSGRPPWMLRTCGGRRHRGRRPAERHRRRALRPRLASTRCSPVAAVLTLALPRRHRRDGSRLPARASRQAPEDASRASRRAGGRRDRRGLRLALVSPGRRRRPGGPPRPLRQDSSSVVTPDSSHCAIASFTDLAASPMMWMSSTSSSGTSAAASSLRPSRYSSCTSVGDRRRTPSARRRACGSSGPWRPCRPCRARSTGLSTSTTGCGSSVISRWQVAAISNVSRVRRAPSPGEALVEPRLVHARARPASRRSGSSRRRSRRSGRRSSGPSAPEPDRDVGAQRVDDRLERLAEPDRARRRRTAAGSAGPSLVTGASRASTWRMMSTTSRVRASGLANGWPYQPSTTCGPRDAHAEDRPGRRDRWSRVSACIAMRGRGAAGHLHDRRAEPEPARSRVPTRPAG